MRSRTLSLFTLVWSLTTRCVFLITLLTFWMITSGYGQTRAEASSRAPGQAQSAGGLSDSHPRADGLYLHREPQREGIHVKGEAADDFDCLRFYSDGTVLAVTVVEPSTRRTADLVVDISKWFGRSAEARAEGTYSLSGATISFIATKMVEGTRVQTSYTGVVAVDSLHLTVSSNGASAQRKFTFERATFVAADSTKPVVASKLASEPASSSDRNLSGSWKVNEWSVDLKYKEISGDDALYCGLGKRTDEGGKELTQEICAVKHEKDNTLLIMLGRAIACEAPFKAEGTIEGRCVFMQFKEFSFTATRVSRNKTK